MNSGNKLEDMKGELDTTGREHGRVDMRQMLPYTSTNSRQLCYMM